MYSPIYFENDRYAIDKNYIIIVLLCFTVKSSADNSNLEESKNKFDSCIFLVIHLVVHVNSKTL